MDFNMLLFGAVLVFLFASIKMIYDSYTQINEMREQLKVSNELIFIIVGILTGRGSSIQLVREESADSCTEDGNDNGK